MPNLAATVPQQWNELLKQFNDLDGCTTNGLAVQRLSGGLINDTFALGDAWILQRLHRIFAATVNLDIQALVPHLLRAGVPVPQLALAKDGKPWVELTEPPEIAGVWRIMNRLEGQTLHRLECADQAYAAAQLVARFHGALRQLPHTFHFSRPGAHDTVQHMANLRLAVAQGTDHRLHREVAILAEEILERWGQWQPTPALPTRIVHGDLKVSNLLFAGQLPVAILDLDTMAAGTLDLELGDALRSWCNRTAEDATEPCFDADIFAAVLDGYRAEAQSWVGQDELRCLPAATLRICLELSARFAADAIRESYFGWDSVAFASRGDHNLARARNQLGLARAVTQALPRLKTAAGH